jgi:hypothetical protein
LWVFVRVEKQLVKIKKKVDRALLCVNEGLEGLGPVSQPKPSCQKHIVKSGLKPFKKCKPTLKAQVVQLKCNVKRALKIKNNLSKDPGGAGLRKKQRVGNPSSSGLISVVDWRSPAQPGGTLGILSSVLTAVNHVVQSSLGIFPAVLHSSSSTGGASRSRSFTQGGQRGAHSAECSALSLGFTDRLKEIRHVVGLLCEGFEEELPALFAAIEASTLSRLRPLALVWEKR